MEERASHCYKRSASGILLCSVGRLTLDGPGLTSRGKGPIPPGGSGDVRWVGGQRRSGLD